MPEHLLELVALLFRADERREARLFTVGCAILVLALVLILTALGSAH